MKNTSAATSAILPADRFLAGCGFFAFAVVAIWVVFFVPMNMDEAGIYHVLACADYPFAPLHTLREACLRQDNLVTPLGLHIARPAFYAGLWHSILYAPFYFLFHAPGGQYALGLCMLFLFAFLLSRETAKPLLSFSIILAFFPFVFQFVHDTGPVSFDMLMFPLGGWLFKKIIREPSPVSIGAAIVLAFFVACAAEDKAFFFYLLPSLGFFMLALAVREENLRDFAAVLKNVRDPLLVAAILSAAGLLLLLFSVNMRGQYYSSWLIDLAGKRVEVQEWLGAFFNFLFYWPYYAHYTFDLTDDYSVASVLFKIVAFSFVILCVLAAIGAPLLKPGAKLRFMLLGLSFASSVVVFFVLRNTWAGHHFVFLWVPLIVLFADLVAGLSPGIAFGIAMGFFALNLLSVVALTQQPVQVRNSSERSAIFHFFADDARASSAIINFSSWGGYFIQSLYGPKNQLVTYSESYDDQKMQSDAPVMPDAAQQLLALSQETGRKIYNVCFGPNCTKAALDAAFGGKLDFKDALPGLPNWRVFAATPRGP